MDQPSVGLTLVGLPSVGLPSVGLTSVGLPLAGLPSVGLPLTCLLGGTVVETSGETCEVTAGLEASVAGPLLEEGVFGKAAELQSLQEEGSAWDLERSCPCS